MRFREKAADKLRLGMGTWTALIGMLLFILGWIGVVEQLHAPLDNPQLTILNLILSTLAGLQGVVLLIASKRGDAIMAGIIEHIRKNTDKIAKETDEIDKLIVENTKLTQEIHRLIKKLTKEDL